MDWASSKPYKRTQSSSISCKVLAFYGHSGGRTLSAAILAAILNYENCSRIQKLYQVFYVFRVSWASESVEKKTISAKSGFTLKIMFGVLTILHIHHHILLYHYNCARSTLEILCTHTGHPNCTRVISIVPLVLFGFNAYTIVFHNLFIYTI